MKAYKLMRLRKDGTLGSLFIDKKTVRLLGEWMVAEDHVTKGYAHRPGWHCTFKPFAPHLNKRGRVWCEVEVDDFAILARPESQGGKWLLAQRMKIIGMVKGT